MPIRILWLLSMMLWLVRSIRLRINVIVLVSLVMMVSDLSVFLMIKMLLLLVIILLVKMRLRLSHVHLLVVLIESLILMPFSRFLLLIIYRSILHIMLCIPTIWVGIHSPILVNVRVAITMFIELAVGFMFSKMLSLTHLSYIIVVLSAIILLIKWMLGERL